MHNETFFLISCNYKNNTTNVSMYRTRKRREPQRYALFSDSSQSSHALQLAAVTGIRHFICHLIPNIPHTFLYDALESRYKQRHRTLPFSKCTMSQSDDQQVNKKTGWLTKMVQVLPNIRGGEAKYRVEWNILTHCGRVTQICVFNAVKLGTSASSP